MNDIKLNILISKVLSALKNKTEDKLFQLQTLILSGMEERAKLSRYLKSDVILSDGGVDINHNASSISEFSTLITNASKKDFEFLAAKDTFRTESILAVDSKDKQELVKYLRATFVAEAPLSESPMSAFIDNVYYLILGNISIFIPELSAQRNNKEVIEVAETLTRLSKNNISIDQLIKLSNSSAKVEFNFSLKTCYFLYKENYYSVRPVHYHWFLNRSADTLSVSTIHNSVPVIPEYSQLQKYLSNIDFGIIGTKIHMSLKFPHLCARLLNSKGDAIIKGGDFLAGVFRQGYLEVIQLNLGELKFHEKMTLPVDSNFLQFLEEKISSARKFWNADVLLKIQKMVMRDSASEISELLKFSFLNDPSINSTFCFETNLNLGDLISIAKSSSGIIINEDGTVSVSELSQLSLNNIFEVESGHKIERWPYGCTVMYGASGSGKSATSRFIKRKEPSTMRFEFCEPGRTWKSDASLMTALQNFINSDSPILIIDSLRMLAFRSGGAFLAGGINSGLLGVVEFLDSLGHSYEKIIIATLNPLLTNENIAEAYKSVFEGSASMFIETRSRGDMIDLTIKSRFINRREAITKSIHI